MKINDKYRKISKERLSIYCCNNAYGRKKFPHFIKEYIKYLSIKYETNLENINLAWILFFTNTDFVY